MAVRAHVRQRDTSHSTDGRDNSLQNTSTFTQNTLHNAQETYTLTNNLLVQFLHFYICPFTEPAVFLIFFLQLPQLPDLPA